MTIDILNTIWSDIIILQKDGHTALVDTGTAENWPVLKSALDRNGISKIDFILLTHFHCDHYGNIETLLENYPVGTVYLKAYSGLDARTSAGKPADDAYRQSETDRYRKIQALAREKSTLIQAEDVTSIPFCGIELRLFSTRNNVRAIYEDASHPETYHQYTQSENQNSLAVFFTAHGVNVFLGGDMHDAPNTHPLADHVNTRVAREIGQPVDIYKAPHHGTPNTASPDALAVYQPKIAIITNHTEYLSEKSDVFSLLKAANPDVRILLTEHHAVRAEITEDGRYTAGEIDL